MSWEAGASVGEVVVPIRPSLFCFGDGDRVSRERRAVSRAAARSEGRRDWPWATPFNRPGDEWECSRCPGRKDLDRRLNGLDVCRREEVRFSTERTLRRLGYGCDCSKGAILTTVIYYWGNALLPVSSAEAWDVVLTYAVWTGLFDHLANGEEYRSVQQVKRSTCSSMHCKKNYEPILHFQEAINLFLTPVRAGSASICVILLKHMLPNDIIINPQSMIQKSTRTCRYKIIPAARKTAEMGVVE